MAQPARLAGVGVFVIAGLSMFTIALFMIGDRQMAFARKFVIYAEFARITGLRPGTIVRVSGAKAGSVKEIEVPARPGAKFRVKLEIVDDLHPIVRTDSLATIQTEGLVGGTVLAVGAGTAAAPPAPENSSIPTQEPFEINDLLVQMGETVRKVNQTIDLLQGDIQRAIVAVADTVEHANTLMASVSDDVKTMASAGARISGDAAQITEDVRSGRGTVGKLLYDDELYRRATAVAKTAEEIASNARKVVEETRQAVAGLQSTDGPIQGVTADLKQTLDHARTAMSGFAENMDALKRNFLFRGFFNRRGYFDLEHMSPADYQRETLTRSGSRHVVRVWLSSAVLFSTDATSGAEHLTGDGRERLASALAPFLDRVNGAILILEGYSQRPARDEQYIQSRERASMVRDYLISTFHLEPEAVGSMPLGRESPGSPGNAPWDGIALAVFMDKR